MIPQTDLAKGKRIVGLKRIFLLVRIATGAVTGIFIGTCFHKDTALWHSYGLEDPEKLSNGILLGMTGQRLLLHKNRLHKTGNRGKIARQTHGAEA